MRREGRRNGQVYEVIEDGVILATYPIKDAVMNEKLVSAIKRNGWGPIYNGEGID